MYARHTSQFSYLKWMFLSINVCVLYHWSYVTVTYVGHPVLSLVSIGGCGLPQRTMVNVTEFVLNLMKNNNNDLLGWDLNSLRNIKTWVHDLLSTGRAGHTLKNPSSMSIKASNHNEQLIYYAWGSGIWTVSETLLIFIELEGLEHTQRGFRARVPVTASYHNEQLIYGVLGPIVSEVSMIYELLRLGRTLRGHGSEPLTVSLRMNKDNYG